MAGFTSEKVTYEGPSVDYSVCQREESQVSSRLTEEFGYALTDLEQTVQSLSDRLHPVLAPSYPVSSAVEADATPEVSPLRDQLHRTHAVTARLYRLIDHLEV